MKIQKFLYHLSIIRAPGRYVNFYNLIRLLVPCEFEEVYVIVPVNGAGDAPGANNIRGAAG